jgi:hypothetical protein
MARKIVIIPAFASSHLLKCWLPNVIQAINPDVILIREGLFPEGPENKGHIDEDFRAKWCHPKYKNAGFDFDETLMLQFIHNLEDRKPGETGFKFNPKVFVDVVSYTGVTNANDCFKMAVSNFDRFEPEVGDFIFPLEPDAFHLESDHDKIHEALAQLHPGEGLQTKWVDFLETQYYTEAINIEAPKWRRFCYCFDNMKGYLQAIDGFMSQSYPRLKRCEDFITYHYPWFVYDKWKKLRYELIWRRDPKYWQDFEMGLQNIQLNSRRKLAQEKRDLEIKTQAFVHASKIIPSESRVLIRPSRQDEAQWAQFIDIEHPLAIQKHPNFVKW